MKAKVYYGLDVKGDRTILATVTGQMSDGTLVYTEIEQKDGRIVTNEDGTPKLLLDNQYARQLRHGCQTFVRL